MSKEKSPHRGLISGITWTIAIITFIAFVLLITNGEDVFTIIAISIVMLWINVFIGYFIWATYFYNLNFGVSKKVWDKIEKAKDAKAIGEPYDAQVLEDEPLFNPYTNQTFGLPPGTVRGMIAFSLLFGATALLIASFGLGGEISQDSLLRDQFEFFKTGFLMMVAFYFGSRSLKYLKGEKSVEQYNTLNAQKKGFISSFSPDKDGGSPPPSGGTDMDGVTDSGPTPNPIATQIVVVDSSDPKGEQNMDSGTSPPITGFDPMAAPKQGQ